MAIKFVALIISLAAVNAGYIEAPQHVTTVQYDQHHHDDHHHHHHHEEPSLAKSVSYSAAPSVSHVYNSYATPVVTANHVYNTPSHYEYAAPVAKTIHYAAAPVAKAIQYSAPIAKTVTYASEPVHHESYNTYPDHVEKSVYVQPQQYHYNHHHDDDHHHHNQHDVPVYSQHQHSAPVVKTLATTSYSHAPVAHRYTSADAKVVYAAVQGPTLAFAKPTQKVVEYAPTHHSYETPVIAKTLQKTIHSHDATISHYTKSIETPNSHIQKYDTRIVSEPQAHYQQHYSAPQAVQYAVDAPVYAHKSAPVLSTKTINYSPAAEVSHATFEGHGTHYHW